MGPIRLLHFSTAFSEMSSTPTTTSEVTNSISPGKKGLPLSETQNLQRVLRRIPVHLTKKSGPFGAC